jgi:hypothetical protein
MKKILSLIFISLLLSGNAYAATSSLKDFKIDDTNQLYSKRNMSYFIKQGYELVLQEKRGVLIRISPPYKHRVISDLPLYYFSLSL